MSDSRIQQCIDRPSTDGRRGRVWPGLVAVLLIAGTAALQAADEASLIAPEHRLVPETPAWRELGERFQRRGDVVADFEEQRHFPFRAEPVVLRGEVRVSAQRGLSLHYTAPQERTVIIDADGMLLREATGGNSAPPDPRANLANAALLHVLNLDFSALVAGYELYGRIDGETWSLGLVPRDPAVRRAIGNILVSGAGESVRRIELRRSARQHIDIAIDAPRATPAFTGEEAARFFR